MSKKKVADRPVNNIHKVSPNVSQVSENEMSANKKFHIVGIGASAGGLKAFEAFFKGIPVKADINIAFVNELAKIFNLMHINTHDVLEAAGTKWNFLPFKPGLVGGHCIGVDPYYLAQKAQEFGYHPEIILAGRRMNDSMGDYVASEIIKSMIKKNIPINGAKVLVLGITFKENCPDVRNTKAVDLVNALSDYNTDITIHDPWANEKEVMIEYGLKSSKSLPNDKFDAVVLTVSHRKFRELDIMSFKNDNSVIYDVKNFLDENIIDGSL